MYFRELAAHFERLLRLFSTPFASLYFTRSLKQKGHWGGSGHFFSAYFLENKITEGLRSVWKHHPMYLETWSCNPLYSLHLLLCLLGSHMYT